MAKKPTPPKDMSVVFASSKGALAQIASKTNSLALLANIVKQICPDLPEGVWHIANFRASTLIIEVKSSVWGQRLQFERNNICKQLVLETNNEFNQIEIKVAPYRNTVAPTQRNTDINLNNSMKISQATAEHLCQIAENAPDSLKLKLQKLALLAKKN